MRRGCISTLSLWLGTAAAFAANSDHLTILATSDLHGHVEARDELSGVDLGEGLARIATEVGRVRAEGHPVLLLDSGDTIQGTPIEAIHARSGKTDDPTIRAMNSVGYDAMCVGNHEFNFGLPVLERARKDAHFPFLAANIEDSAGHPVFLPYLVVRRAGLRIGILGLTTRGILHSEPPEHIAGLRVLDSVETARRYLPILRGKEHCGFIIVLTHQGFERDLDLGAVDPDAAWRWENQAYALASEVPGIDLILAGHAHRDVPPRRIGDVWVSEPGRFGNLVTRLDLAIEDGRVTAVSGSNLPMKEVLPDRRIEALVEPETSAAEKVLSESAARLETPQSIKNARVADSPLLDWLADVERRAAGSDLAVVSLLNPTLPDWSAGPLTVRQIWSFYPYDNSLVTVRATGRQIREALDQAAGCFSGIEESGGTVGWRRNRAVWFYNCDALQGAEYALNPARPEGSRVLYLRRNGREIADDDVLTVALNSYRASGGGGYTVWKDLERVAISKESVRDLLIADARSREHLRLSADQNWVLVPELPELP
jgi:2',3'-cyclic-nucleotide 2'-phosphodiesterase (5'-nucleotidase family)